MNQQGSDIRLGELLHLLQIKAGLHERQSKSKKKNNNTWRCSNLYCPAKMPNLTVYDTCAFCLQKFQNGADVTLLLYLC